jgi:hypothetical protein
MFGTYGVQPLRSKDEHMSERQEIVELTDTVSLGFLSSDLVLALGRLVRQENLSSRDRDALRSGHDLLERLGNPEPTLQPTPGPRLLTSDAVDVEVFRAARVQEPGEPVKAVIARMAALLERATTRPFEPADAKAADQVRRLFVYLGDMTLSRADDLLKTPHHERPAWLDPTATSIS